MTRNRLVKQFLLKLKEALVLGENRENEPPAVDFSGDESTMARHLDNAIRRINEVILELTHVRRWQEDMSWTMGRFMRSALNRTPEITSVAFLGKTGSHSHHSARSQYPTADMHPVSSFAEACESVLTGKASAAVLPVDNSTAGTIAEVYDLLAGNDLHIVQASSLSIRNVLLGVQGTRLSDIQEVWTHPQPIMQCAAFLKRWGWKVVPMASTAAAAAACASGADKRVAAIGSRDAAALYGLEVLAEGIDDTDSNQTRFVTVMKELQIPLHATRVSLIFSVAHKSGALASVLAMLADYQLNVTKIQSRPIPHRPWEYSFHLDFESQPEDAGAWEALYLMSRELPQLKLLGWYPEHVPSKQEAAPDKG